MNFLTSLSVGRSARADARVRVDAADERIVERLGPRPEWNPTGNAEHGLIAAALGSRAEVEELRADSQREEDEIALHPPPAGLLLAIVFAGLCECFGAVLVMRALGLENPERLILGVAFALGVLGFTALVARRTPASPRPEPGVAGRRFVKFAALVVYALLMVAIAYVRTREAADPEGGDVGHWMTGIVLLATTVLPAFTVHALVERRAPGVRARRNRRNLLRRMARLESERMRAEVFRRDLARRQERWDHEAARLRARYRTVQQLTAREDSHHEE